MGCCVLIPGLAAAGIAGSGLQLVGAQWFEPVGFALIVIGIVAVVLSLIQNQRRRRANAGCAAGGEAGCGCGNEVGTEPSTDAIS